MGFAYSETDCWRAVELANQSAGIIPPQALWHCVRSPLEQHTTSEQRLRRYWKYAIFIHMRTLQCVRSTLEQHNTK